jgi:hypothetical protein
MFIVGASLLAMDVNDNAPCLDERGAQAFFASRLAPTGGFIALVSLDDHPGPVCG